MEGFFYAALRSPSEISGLTGGARSWGPPRNRQILRAVLRLAAGSVATALATSAPWFARACLFTGLAFGPLITALSLQLGALAPSSTVTEAFTWSTTLLMLGLGLGMWAGGALVRDRLFAYGLVQFARNDGDTWNDVNAGIDSDAHTGSPSWLLKMD
mgnify:CR=1 FL=1